MKTVYAVNTGEYSDYRIVAIFSTRKLAKEFMEAVPDGYGGYNDLQEFNLDPPTTDILRRGYSVWHVLMLRDGTTEKVMKTENDQFDIRQAGEARIWKRTEAPAYRGKGIPDVLYLHCWAKTEKQAVKIANEHRTQLIAGGKWL